MRYMYKYNSYYIYMYNVYTQHSTTTCWLTTIFNPRTNVNSSGQPSSIPTVCLPVCVYVCLFRCFAMVDMPVIAFMYSRWRPVVLLRDLLLLFIGRFSTLYPLTPGRSSNLHHTQLFHPVRPRLHWTIFLDRSEWWLKAMHSVNEGFVSTGTCCSWTSKQNICKDQTSANAANHDELMVLADVSTCMEALIDMSTKVQHMVYKVSCIICSWFI